MSYYPVSLDVRGRRCVVVGGDALAEEKARGLAAALARVVAITPSPTPGLSELSRAGTVQLLHRPYRHGDLAGAFLVVVAQGETRERQAIWLEALQNRALVNSVDDLPRCNFIAPAIVRRGDLTVAISTGGKAPALAVRLRQQLERQLGEEHGRFLELAGAMRPAVAALHPELERRRELWYRLVDSDVLDLLRRGEEEEARERFAQLLAGSAPQETGDPIAVALSGETGEATEETGA